MKARTATQIWVALPEMIGFLETGADRPATFEMLFRAEYVHEDLETGWYAAQRLW
jgi:hypothetical protein